MRGYRFQNENDLSTESVAKTVEFAGIVRSRRFWSGFFLKSKDQFSSKKVNFRKLIPLPQEERKALDRRGWGSLNPQAITGNLGQISFELDIRFHSVNNNITIN